MERLVVARVLALTGLVGVGAAAPGAVWFAQHPEAFDRDGAGQALSFRGGISTGLQLPTPKLVLQRPTTKVALVRLEPVVIVAPKAAPRVAVDPVDRTEAAGGRSCHQQASETFDRGNVRVCDVDRTAVERGTGVFGGIDKGTRLAPRDRPSPSGLADGL